MKLLMIAFLLIFQTTIPAQSTSDSTKSKSENEKGVYNFHLFLLEQQLTLNSFDDNLFSPQSRLYSLPEVQSKFNNKFYLDDYFFDAYQLNLKNQSRSSLGGFGKVLGYVQAAAAVGFAGYHLYKYRKEYGLD
ncbi:MAG: hypothetical protein K9I99_03065 [Melioribacteraceae bacterium]|nr:hypothetical protein [Melioribacteraceae bacterium]